MSATESEEKQGLGVGIWVMILTLLGIYVLPAWYSSMRPAETPAPAQGDAQVSTEHRPASEGRHPVSGNEKDDLVKILEPLRIFRGLPQDAGGQDRLDELLANGTAYEVDLMIAAVSDPLVSVGKDWFDSSIDALQRAAESRDFVLDRFRLPQGADERPPVGTSRVLLAGQKPPASGIGPPGLLLFRKSPMSESGTPKPIQLLAVLLVPESPTWGMDKDALKVAFTLAERKGRLDQCGGTSASAGTGGLKIRIVGPNFSGSQASMEQAMASWLREPCHVCGSGVKFLWYTGSATSIDVNSFKRFPLDGRVEFKSMAHNTKDTMRAVEDYIRKRGWPVDGASRVGRVSPPLGLLVESNTGFGSSVSTNVMAELAEGGRAGYIYPFPMRIAQLRVSYSHRGLLSGVKATPIMGPERLPVPFGGGGGHLDVLPSNSPESSASNDELLLTQMLLDIQSRKFPYVAILATEREDTLFLARMVHRYCPSSRLILFNSDASYRHPEHLRFLRGALIVGPYPLNLRNQSWSYPYQGHKRALGLSSEWAYGTYNAMVAHLWELESSKVDPAVTLAAGRGGSRGFLEYGQPFVEILKQFNLRLIRSVSDVSHIGNSGTNLVIVANVQEVLHFRIFDGKGNRVVDTDEMRLTKQARPIADLKRQLESLWPRPQLTRSEQDRIIDAVISIVGYTPPGPVWITVVGQRGSYPLATFDKLDEPDYLYSRGDNAAPSLQTEGYDLQLMSSLPDVSGIRPEGKELVPKQA